MLESYKKNKQLKQFSIHFPLLNINRLSHVPIVTRKSFAVVLTAHTSALGPINMSPSKAPAMTRTCLGLPTLTLKMCQLTSINSVPGKTFLVHILVKNTCLIEMVFHRSVHSFKRACASCQSNWTAIFVR